MDDEDDGSASIHDMLDDKRRVAYFKNYLANVSQAIKWANIFPFIDMFTSNKNLGNTDIEFYRVNSHYTISLTVECVLLMAKIETETEWT